MSSKIHNVPLIFHLNYFKSPLYLAVENGNKKEIFDDLLKTKASFPIKVKKVMPYQKESHLFMLPSSNVTEVITISLLTRK